MTPDVFISLHGRQGSRTCNSVPASWAATVEALRGTVLGLSLITEAELPAVLAECRAHLRQPDTAFTMYTVAQVWGRKDR
jgi:hypothetical protein